MQILPDLETFKQLASQGNLIPLYTDLMADFETPVSAYEKLRREGPAYLLESIEGGATLNRYSFIGFRPVKSIRATIGGQTVIRDREGMETQMETPADPLQIIEKEMARYEPVKLEGMPRFVGGAVGMIGYEYIHCIEPTVPLAEKNPLGMPTLHFLITDTVVIFDRAKQTLRLLVNVPTEGDVTAAYEQACAQLRQLADMLRQGREVPTLPLPPQPEVSPLPGNMERATFEQMVENCKAYIRAGDTIQIVGSQRFEKAFHASPMALYRVLRTVNPSPYMFIYEAEDFALVGASPEVHVRLTDGLAEVRPIAGTRPRGVNAAEDRALEQDLLADEKERAEHLMLVDLARNDLGRVCAYGSVRVPEYMTVEHYSHVMHIVSQVEGTITPEHNAYDLMRATFPAGTVSGAPKIRAMQIIAEQEGEQRGPYAGALTYFSYDGNLDSCIAIRTALIKDQTIYIQSGAGLVADSVPANEYQETVNKAKGMLKAVAMAEALGQA